MPHPNGAFFATLGWDSTDLFFSGLPLRSGRRHITTATFPKWTATDRETNLQTTAHLPEPRLASTGRTRTCGTRLFNRHRHVAPGALHSPHDRRTPSLPPVATIPFPHFQLLSSPRQIQLCRNLRPIPRVSRSHAVPLCHPHLRIRNHARACPSLSK
jgi:hypothetical protein